ncbi:hypothetical protein C0581_04550, partial [Candidatus Parcubacteria bacterium]
EYKYTSSTQPYVLYAPFEFFEAADPFVSQFIDTNAVQFGRSCTPGQVQSKYQGVCGDGVLNPDLEECDPPGKNQITQSAQCAAGEYKIATCSDICEWTYGDCTIGSTATCGDGVVDW